MGRNDRFGTAEMKYRQIRVSAFLHFGKSKYCRNDRLGNIFHTKNQEIGNIIFLNYVY
ncbi:unnamed protein product, partial [Rotaria socialis]